MRFPLRRFYQDERQTLGMLAIGPVTIFTIERPWVNNQPFKSRFPAGAYHMAIIEIEGREKIRLESRLMYDARASSAPPPMERTLLNIEIANWARQLEGCVGVGMGVRRDPRASVREKALIYSVTDSKIALARLLTEIKRWPDVPMFLEVEDCF